MQFPSYQTMCFHLKFGITEIHIKLATEDSFESVAILKSNIVLVSLHQLKDPFKVC